MPACAGRRWPFLVRALRVCQCRRRTFALRSPARQRREDLRKRSIEERAPLYSDLLHLYVVWGEWAGMGQRERSKIIMNAYQLARPEHPENVTAVTVAMGLTPEEAKRMGIEYAPLEPVA